MTKTLSVAEHIVLTLQYHAAAVAMLTVLAGAAIYVLWRPRGGVPRQLFGPQRWWAIPWQLPEVLMAALILLWVAENVFRVAPFLHTKLPPTAFDGFQINAAYAAVVGPNDFGLSSALTVAGGTLYAFPAEKARLVGTSRAFMLTQLVLFPFLIWLVIHMMRRLVNARPYQMGLHLNRWRENVTLGCIGWLLAVPVVLFVFLFLKLEFWTTLWGPPTEHPISRLINQDPSVFTWVLSILTTLVVAPLVEEFLLRGVVQPYLVRWPMASDLVILFVVSAAVFSMFNTAEATGRGQGMGPLLLVLFVAVGYYFFERLTWQWLPDPGAARGIFAASLIFAALHGSAWPSPIPLFVLSMMLGFLAYRTGSLIGPITLHALFNATGLIVKYLESANR